jgi:isoamylase
MRSSPRWKTTNATTRATRVQATPSTPTIPWFGTTSLRRSAIGWSRCFRFDLAAVLGRDGNGNLLANPPLLEKIAEDPILRDVKIIAEAWDAAGAYEVGSFSERRWTECNGQYRDDVTRFWRGDHEGADANFSRNYGAEGKTTDVEIEDLRKRQIKNFLLTLLISRVVPMLLGGDEFRRTQGGNNNAYCQDNETSCLDWSCLEQHREIFRFTLGMIAFRRAHPALSQGQFYTDSEIHWCGLEGGLPNWTNPKQKQFACLIHEDELSALYLMFNADTDAIDFNLPSAPPEARWHLAVDTAHEVPQDLFVAGEEPVWENSQTYHLSPRSSVILLARGTNVKSLQTTLTEIQ